MTYFISNSNQGAGDYMKIIILMFFGLSFILQASEVGKTFEVSKTLDFINTKTGHNLRIVKRSTSSPYYLTVMSRRGSKLKVIIRDNKSNSPYGKQEFPLSRKFFKRGVLEQPIKMLASVSQQVKMIGSLKQDKYCADCASNFSNRPLGDDILGYYGTINKHSKVKDSSLCRHFRTFVRQGVPSDALKQALTFYKSHKKLFSSKAGRRYISIADYSQNSRRKRFYLLDLVTGKVKRYQVSHGNGKQRGRYYGDPNHDGMLDRCTSPTGSRQNMTRVGFFQTLRLGNSPNHGPNKWPTLAGSRRHPLDHLKLKGLSPGVNDEAVRRHIYMHGANYNHGGVMGRSFGCPAFNYNEASMVIPKLAGGTLYYSTTRNKVCKKEMRKVLRQVPGWKSMCN